MKKPNNSFIFVRINNVYEKQVKIQIRKNYIFPDISF